MATDTTRKTALYGHHERATGFDFLSFGTGYDPRGLDGALVIDAVETEWYRAWPAAARDRLPAEEDRPADARPTRVGTLTWDAETGAWEATFARPPS